MLHPGLDTESGDGDDRLFFLEAHGWSGENSQNFRKAHLEIMRIQTCNVAMSNTHKLRLTMSQITPLVHINNIISQYLLCLLFCAEHSSRHQNNNQNLPRNNFSSLILVKQMRLP